MDKAATELTDERVEWLAQRGFNQNTIGRVFGFSQRTISQEFGLAYREGRKAFLAQAGAYPGGQRERIVGEFDTSRLDERGQAAWEAQVQRLGTRKARSGYDIFLYWVDVLRCEGGSKDDIRETIMVSQHKSDMLKSFGPEVHAQALVVAQAMVNQAIEELCP